MELAHLQDVHLDFFYLAVSKLAIIVESDQKAPFSIATTPFPGLLHYPWYVPYIAEC